MLKKLFEKVSICLFILGSFVTVEVEAKIKGNFTMKLLCIVSWTYTMTLSITTFSITTLSTRGLYVKLIISDTQHKNSLSVC